jgi:hypothetical protein
MFFRKFTNVQDVQRSVDASAVTAQFSPSVVIGKKHAALGGDAGVLGVPIEDVKPCPDGQGHFRRFAHGMIYTHPRSGTHEIHGAILDKWTQLGFERSHLGYPLTDELGTPDGVGRFNRFQGGMIYCSPATGAHELHGDILHRWEGLGYERSWLGYPTSDELAFDADGRVSTFQHGAIYWWADTGAVELRNNEVVVHYTGLICFGETDWDQMTDNDEPYLVFGLVSATGYTAIKTQVYQGVDAGESRNDFLELYRGPPRGLSLHAILIEHDSDDPQAYLDAMKTAVSTVFSAAGSLLTLIPVVGPALSVGLGPLFQALGGAVGATLHGALDLGDDWLGACDTQLTPKEMVLLAARTSNSESKGIGHKFESPLFQRDGATYRAYFGIVPT